MPKVTCVIDAKNKLGEVPVWCPIEQALYWVDIEQKLLQRFEPSSGAVKVWEMPERIASFALREQGGMIVALASRICFFDLDTGGIEQIAAPDAHVPRNRFNEGKCDRKGRFWAATMDDRLVEHTGSLYRVDPDRSVHQMETGIAISNSIVWSPDNKTMYFADTRDRTIYAYDFAFETGAISNRRVFCTTLDQPGNPDGSTIDSEGYLWNAQWNGWRVVRYAPNGRIDRIVEMPIQYPSSCMFGGADLGTLYVTSAFWDLTPEQRRKQPQAGGLFAVDAGVRGLPEPRFAG